MIEAIYILLYKCEKICEFVFPDLVLFYSYNSFTYLTLTRETCYIEEI